MSWDKWILRGLGGEVFVVKRNDITGLVVVGGHKEYRTAMEHSIETGLGMDSPENAHSQRGRIRMEVKNVEKPRWNQALRIWNEDWRAERSSAHGRLI